MSSIIVSAKDFRQNFPQYQDLVQNGISITIVKRSKPIFRLEPVDPEFDAQITKALLDYQSNKDENFVSYDDVFSS
jgi:prevent-host-death family protein